MVSCPYPTEVAPLANAALAQGLSLSPILVLILQLRVDQWVPFPRRCVGLIDDYFRWQVGRSAKENLAKIQSEDIPSIEVLSCHPDTYLLIL